jgi:outer membrane protein TolC
MRRICEEKKMSRNCITNFGKILKVTFIVLVGFNSSSLSIYAQNITKRDSVQYFNLDQCIVYALQNQPALRQSSLEILIARKTNAINISAWIPQVNLSGTFTHYDPLPTTFSPNTSNPDGPLINGHSGFINTFLPQLSATQTIINPDVLYATRSAHLLVSEAQQSNDSSKINLITNVSKAFYSLLLTLEQMKVLQDDTVRLGKTLRDAYHQYIGGIVDKTDYKEATILLNNSKAQLKQAKESVNPQYATLKQLMGFPPDKEFSVSIDTAQMMREIIFDTTQKLEYEKRIEYQQLLTTKSLQQLLVKYYKNQFLPSLSAFYNYTYEYESNTFPTFLNQGYPYSYLGASISIPLFTGMRRMESIQKAKLQGQQIDWALVSLKSNIYSEYAAALANYKSNLFDLNILRENVAMAKDVYGVVSLQYKQGLIAYLNVITAESNLISSEINYQNALFQLLLSKVDLEKAMGKTPVK